MGQHLIALICILSLPVGSSLFHVFLAHLHRQITCLCLNTPSTFLSPSLLRPKAPSLYTHSCQSPHTLQGQVSCPGPPAQQLVLASTLLARGTCYLVLLTVTICMPVPCCLHQLFALPLRPKTQPLYPPKNLQSTMFAGHLLPS